MMTCTNIFWKW